MKNVIDFRSKNKKKSGFYIDSDINKLLKQAIEVGKQELGKFEEGIFKPEVDLKTLFASRINTILMQERCIDTEIFRCSLYVAEMLESIINKIPESYFVIDYYIKGWQEENPFWYQKGGDFCCMVCILFEDFANRRNMHSLDFIRMGMHLYYLYYQNSSDSIGWCMSNNFRGIVEATKRGIKTL